MAQTLGELLEKLEAGAKDGVSLHNHITLRALRIEQVKKALEELLSKGYSLVGATNMASSASDIALVELTFLPPSGSAYLSLPSVIVSFKSDTGEFLSITEPFERDQSTASGAALPFALATPSFSEAAAVGDDFEPFAIMQARRATYTTEIVGQSSLASTTSYETQSQTGYPSSYFTQYPTSGLTTPNDNDTKTDERADSSTDYKTDFSPDGRQDPDSSDLLAQFSPLNTQTPETTNSQSGYPSSGPTGYPTTAMTTTNDNDTRTDERADSRTDYRTDTTPDSRQDD